MTRIVILLLQWIGVALFWSPFRSAIIWFNRRSVKVVLYHACVPEEDDFTKGLRSVTPPEVLAAHLDYLTKYYHVVDLDRLTSSGRGDRIAVITFDDGYRSTYEHAFPALRVRRLPATMYLVPAVVDNREMVWVNELNWFLRRHPAVTRPRALRLAGCPVDTPPEGIIAGIMTSCQRTVVEGMLAELRATLGIAYQEWCRDAALYVTWEDVAEMAQYGITFGNHTNHHFSLPGMTNEEAREEVRTAHEALRDRPGSVMSFAYPFGLRSEATRTIVQAAGYESIMEVGGTNPVLDPMRIARVPLAGESVSQLFAQMELVAPVKAWAARLLRPAT